MARAEHSIIVGVPVAEAYAIWHQFDNFPQFMNNVKEVSKQDAEGKISHWKVAGPFGMNVCHWPRLRCSVSTYRIEAAVSSAHATASR